MRTSTPRRIRFRRVRRALTGAGVALAALGQEVAAQLIISPWLSTSSEVDFHTLLPGDEGIGSTLGYFLLGYAPNELPAEYPRRYSGTVFGLSIVSENGGRYGFGGSLAFSHSRSPEGSLVRSIELLALVRGWAGEVVYVDATAGVSGVWWRGSSSQSELAPYRLTLGPALGVLVPFTDGLGIDVAGTVRYRWSPFARDYVGVAARAGLTYVVGP